MSARHRLPTGRAWALAASLGSLAACAASPVPSQPPQTTTPPTALQERRTMTATVYDAFRIAADGKTDALGTVSITGGRLAIVSLLREADRSAVQADLDEFNNREFLVEKAPPAGDQAGRYGLGAREYQRGEPDFDAVLVRKLESSRALRLMPAR